MSKYSHRANINAPPPEVWAAMVDVESWPAWASQFKRLDRLDAGPLALASRVRVRPKGQLASVWQVIEYDDGRSFIWASNLMPGLRITGGHVLTPDGDGTTAEFWLDASGPLGTLLGPVLRRLIFSRNTRSAATGLKTHIESRARSLVA